MGGCECCWEYITHQERLWADKCSSTLYILVNFNYPIDWKADCSFGQAEDASRCSELASTSTRSAITTLAVPPLRLVV